jgi:hypothetical protein
MPTDPPDRRRFRRLCATSCPPYADVLAAAAAELGAAARPSDVTAALDDHARALFGLARVAPGLRPQRLAAVAFGELGYRVRTTDEGDDLLLPAVVAARRGDPSVVAAVLADLGRRAGVPVVVAGCPARWYVGTGSHGRLFLLDVGPRDLHARAAPQRAAVLCAHALVREVLLLVAQRAHRSGDRERARRADSLVGDLPGAREAGG